MRIEIFSRKLPLMRPKWFFRVRAGNGEIIAQSEAYSRRMDALGTAHALRTGLSRAEISDPLRDEGDVW
jgi:uncharacterized protein YegP (UPF0339 family)